MKFSDIYDVNPASSKEKVISGDNYRITVITDRILRLEYSESGRFTDEATQVVINRDFGTAKFTCDDGENLELETEHIKLIYDKKKFSNEGLSITFKAATGQSATYRYGDRINGLLKGTCRTLDDVNGAPHLEDSFLSVDGFGIIDDSSSLILGEDDMVIEREKGTDFYFLAHGRDYKSAIMDFYRLTGNPPRVPRFVFENWWSRYWHYTDEELTGLMDRFSEENIPLGVCIVDMDWHKTDIPKEYGNGWTGFSWNTDLFPDYRAFLKGLHDRNLKVALNLHPADGIRGFEDMYPEMAAAMGIDPSTKSPVAFDVADKKFMNAYFENVIRPYEKDGVDFWWLDWQQGDKSSVRNLDPLWMINHLHYLDSARQGVGLTFSRYAGLGSHRYPIGFSGDSHMTWDSLQFQPYFTSYASNVGYGLWSHDIGGHFKGVQDDELYLRWVQLGVFSPVLRLHSSKSKFNSREPWRYPMEIRHHAAEYLRLRHSLVPYIYSSYLENTEGGMPIVRPLHFEEPFDGRSYEYKTQFWFGSEMMIAPVITKNIPELKKAMTKVYLPAGTWYDFFTGERLEGNTVITRYSSLGEYNAFVREGGIVPMDIDGELVIRTYGADGEYVLRDESGSHTLKLKSGKLEAQDNLDFTQEVFQQEMTDEELLSRLLKLTFEANVPLADKNRLEWESRVFDKGVSISDRIRDLIGTDINENLREMLLAELASRM